MGVVSRKWVWVESVSVASGCGWNTVYGCGCKEVYRFPHTTYPYSSKFLYLLFFAAASLLFVHLKNVFCSCVSRVSKFHSSNYTQYFN